MYFLMLCKTTCTSVFPTLNIMPDKSDAEFIQLCRNTFRQVLNIRLTRFINTLFVVSWKVTDVCQMTRLPQCLVEMSGNSYKINICQETINKSRHCWNSGALQKFTKLLGRIFDQVLTCCSNDMIYKNNL